MNKTIRTILLGAAVAGVAVPAAAEATTRGQRGVRQTTPAQRAARQSRRSMAPRRTRAYRPQAGLPRGASQRVRADLAVEAAGYSQYMEQAILSFSTPPFFLLPRTSNVRMNQTRNGSYKEHITPRFDVSGLEADGGISFRALLPVSGHVDSPDPARPNQPNPRNADSYAKSNVYDVSVQYADGTRESFVVNSTGYVTEHDLDLKLKPGTNFVRFAPRGSGGVGGFKSGREIELNWTGN